MLTGTGYGEAARTGGLEKPPLPVGAGTRGAATGRDRDLPGARRSGAGLPGARGLHPEARARRPAAPARGPADSLALRAGLPQVPRARRPGTGCAGAALRRCHARGTVDSPWAPGVGPVAADPP